LKKLQISDQSLINIRTASPFTFPLKTNPLTGMPAMQRVMESTISTASSGKGNLILPIDTYSKSSELVLKKTQLGGSIKRSGPIAKGAIRQFFPFQLLDKSHLSSPESLGAANENEKDKVL
jgi:hypothetical protein